MVSALPLGILGATLILFAFLMSEFGKWNADTWTYDLMNAVGGFLLVVYAIDGGAWPFVALNGIWTTFALRDVLFPKRKSKKRAT